MGRKIAARLWLAAIVMIAAGCASVVPPELLHPVSVQKLQYYRGLVKGFEHTYPRRNILILKVDDTCQTQAGQGVAAGDYQVGETLDVKGDVLQRLYLPSMAAQVQDALITAATEAGMVAVKGTDASYAGNLLPTDYVLQSKVVRCSVKKRRIMAGDEGPTWQTVANFAIAATIYKPPFHVPFWQGLSAETYSDPPDINAGTGDDVSIYGNPGQVLSVAFTRSVEEIFARADLHTLIIQDRALRR